MTVAELIKKLSIYDPDARVKIEYTNYCADDGHYQQIRSVDIVLSNAEDETVTIVAEID